MVTVRLSSTTLFLSSLSGRLLSQPPESTVCFFFYVKSIAFFEKKEVVFDYMVQEIRWVFFVFQIFLLYLMVYYVV